MGFTVRPCQLFDDNLSRTENELLQHTDRVQVVVDVSPKMGDIGTNEGHRKEQSEELLG